MCAQGVHVYVKMGVYMPGKEHVSMNLSVANAIVHVGFFSMFTFGAEGEIL